MQECCSEVPLPLGLVLACLLSGSTDVTASPSCYMTQPSVIPILSPVLFMHVGDPYIPPGYLIYLLDIKLQAQGCVEPKGQVLYTGYVQQLNMSNVTNSQYMSK